MKHLILAVLGFCLLAPAALAADSATAQRAFVQGVQAYEAGDFATAAALFEEAGQYLSSGRLCYNLGNAWLKAGDLGRAVLWYERASRYLPRDPELKFNLEYARSLLRDAPGEKPGALSSVLFFWRGSLPPCWLQGLSLAAAWLAGLGLGLNLFRPRRAFQGLALAGSLALLLVLPSTLADWYEAAHGGRGVVLAETLPVRSGLNPDATELFSLHAGAGVRIESRRDGYVRLRYAPDKLGWAEASGVAELWPKGEGQGVATREGQGMVEEERRGMAEDAQKALDDAGDSG